MDISKVRGLRVEDEFFGCAPRDDVKNDARMAPERFFKCFSITFLESVPIRVSTLD